MLGFKTFAESPISSLAKLDDVNVAPTGQVGTGAVGSLSFSLEVNFLVSQDTEEVAAATTGLGTPTIVIPKSFSISGQVGTSALGSAVAKADSDVAVTGQAATTGLSGIGVNGGVIAIIPSLSSSLGSVSVTIDAEANVSIPLEDEGEAELGTPSITASSINRVN